MRTFKNIEENPTLSSNFLSINEFSSSNIDDFKYYYYFNYSNLNNEAKISINNPIEGYTYKINIYDEFGNKLIKTLDAKLNDDNSLSIDNFTMDKSFQYEIVATNETSTIKSLRQTVILSKENDFNIAYEHNDSYNTWFWNCYVPWYEDINGNFPVGSEISTKEQYDEWFKNKYSKWYYDKYNTTPEYTILEFPLSHLKLSIYDESNGSIYITDSPCNTLSDIMQGTEYSNLLFNKNNNIIVDNKYIYYVDKQNGYWTEIKSNMDASNNIILNDYIDVNENSPINIGINNSLLDSNTNYYWYTDLDDTLHKLDIFNGDLSSIILNPINDNCSFKVYLVQKNSDGTI